MAWPPNSVGTNTELKTKTLCVDYYAIDIGDAGDCGIYYLIEHPPAGTSGLPFIHRAVLIDGGYKVGAAKIQAFLNLFLKKDAGGALIQMFYHFEDTQGGRANLAFPPFDSIVITHWDKDHYQGIIKLIHDHVMAASLVPGADMTRYFSPFMKYDTAAAGAPRDQRACTRIYAPYWGDPVVRGKVKMGFPAAIKDWQERPFTYNTTPVGGVIPSPPYIDPTVFLDWKTGPAVWVPRLCRIGCGLQYLLGMNVFTGERYTPGGVAASLGPAQDLRTPQQLALYHQTGNVPNLTGNPPRVTPPIANAAAWPILGIVAGMSKDGDDEIWTNKGCGDTALNRQTDQEITTLAARVLTAADLVRDQSRENEATQLIEPEVSRSLSSGLASAVGSSLTREEGREPPVMVVNKPLKLSQGEYTNASSLITMVIWTTGQMSCYAAGDANWENELRVLAWVTSQSLNPYQSVRTVKLSHHGSGFSTPVELIRSFKPRNIVVMANPQNFLGLSHYHPRPEVLIWLKYWFTATRQDRVVILPTNTVGRTGWVKATAFPYYLTWENGGYKFKLKPKNLNAFRPASTLPGVAQYQNSLKTLTAALLPTDTTANILADFTAKGADQPGLIAERTARAWGPLSDVGFVSTGIGATVFRSDRYAPTDCDQRIQFVWTACRPVDQGRRNATDKLIDGFAMSVTKSMMENNSEASKIFTLRCMQGVLREETAPLRFPRLQAQVDVANIPESKVEASSSSAMANSGVAGAAMDRHRINRVEYTRKRKREFFSPGPGPIIIPPAQGSSTTSSTHPMVAIDLSPVPATPFYLAPDFIAPILTSPDPSLVIYQILSGDVPGFDPFSTFISKLDQPALHVEVSGSLSTDDELRQWLPMTVLVDPATTGVDVSIQLGGAQTSVSVQSFTMTLPVTNANPTMAFSTANLQGNFSHRSGPGPTLPSTFTGYWPFHGFLMLGLTPASKGDKTNPSPATTWKLSQIFQQINVDTGASTSGGAVLEALLDVFQNQSDHKMFLQKGMIWFVPEENYLTIQRLEWGLETAAEQTLKTWCITWLKLAITIQNVNIVSRRETTRVCSPDGWDLAHIHEFLVMFELTRTKDGDPKTAPIITCGLDFNLSTGSSNLTATFRIDPTTNTINDGILDFLEWLLPSATRDFAALETFIPAINNIRLRSVSVTIGKDDIGPSVNRVVLNAEYSDPTWTVTDDHGDTTVVPLLLTYTYTKALAQPHGVRITVWFEPDIMTWLQPQLMPRYEDLYSIRPTNPAPAGVRLNTLMPRAKFKLPNELDLEITDLELNLADTTITFTGTLSKDPTQDAKSSLGISLDEVSLTASYTWTSKDDSSPDPSSYSVDLHIELDLGPDPNQATSLASIEDDNEDGDPNGYISCDLSVVSQGSDKVFQLLGSISNVSLAQFARFFPDGDSHIVTSLLGHIVITTLGLEYNYDTAGAARNFSFQASLMLDVLELDLIFTRDQTDWSFDATLEAAASLTIDTILNEVMGPNSHLVGDIPDFVKQIDISNASIHLSVRSHKPPPTDPASSDPPTDNGSVVICLELDLPGPEDTTLALAFYQITEKAAPGSQADVLATKRLFKVTLDGLPWNKIPKIPVIDSMKSPFDELGFYWVSDPTWKDPTLQPGLTRAEVEKLNAISPVIFKDPSSSTGTTTDPTQAAASAKVIVLNAGWHFLVLDSGGQGSSEAILDYLFNKPKAPTPAPAAHLEQPQESTALVKLGDGDDNDDPTSTGTSKGAFHKTIGPFTIENVGIRYQDSQLTLFLDILTALGPIGLNLLGFGISIDLSKSSLKDIILQVPSFSLQGMGVEFDEPPIGVAGLFFERQTDAMKMYAGGISLTIDPYNFIAVGAYGEVTPTSGPSYKTVFFFAKLDGPLIELEFITIGGICLGFGYNSRLRFPSVTEVPSYPLIANSSLGGSDPLATMDQLANPAVGVPIISPENGCYWLAAGLDGKLLHVLDVSAVVVLEFNPYVSLGIFAKAIGEMPEVEPFVYIELGIAATIDFHAGTMCIQAQLTPNSFIIDPNCHLTGGFGLCTWFPPSEHAGDFIFTVGGYHNAYRPPAHYPVPPRVGISWSVDSNTSITGRAYFAITPKACMAGGTLQVNYDAGLLHAWLTAWADCLINYHPFSMLITIGIEVGVSFTLELLFISIDISVSIGAELTLWAVPFGGNVYIDFWVFGFSVGFGANNAQGEAKSLADFRNLLIEIPDASAPSAGTSPTVDKLHTLSVENGMYTQDSKDSEVKQSQLWDIKQGGFVFRVQSRVPLRSISQTTTATTATLATPFYATPMLLSEPLRSTMTVVVTRDDEVAARKKGEQKFTLQSQVLKQAPLALWGIVDDQHPALGQGNNNVETLLDSSSAGTVELMMGASFHAPAPQISADILVPIQVLKSLALDVFTDKDRPNTGIGDGHPKIPADVTIQSAEWDSAQPVAGEPQWANVATSWKTPDILIPAAADGTAQSPVDVTMALWNEAFDWSSNPADDPDVSVSQLRHQLKGTGDQEPRVWKDFEKLYMSAPLIGGAGAGFRDTQ